LPEFSSDADDAEFTCLGSYATCGLPFFSLFFANRMVMCGSFSLRQNVQRAVHRAESRRRRAPEMCSVTLAKPATL